VWRMASASGIQFMVRTSMAPCACSCILASTTAQDTVHGESGWSDDLTYWCRLAMASGEVVGRRPLVLPTSSYRINSIASAGKLVLFRCVLVVPSTRRRPFLYIYVHHHLKPHGAALRWSCRPIRFLDRMSISRTSKTYPFGLEKRGCDAARQATASPALIAESPTAICTQMERRVVWPSVGEPLPCPEQNAC
jgi:hypothetical protein